MTLRLFFVCETKIFVARTKSRVVALRATSLAATVCFFDSCCWAKRCMLTQNVAPAYILNKDTQLVMRAIGVSHTACKDEFRRNLRSHSWSVFSFFII